MEYRIISERFFIYLLIAPVLLNLHIFQCMCWSFCVYACNNRSDQQITGSGAFVSAAIYIKHMADNAKTTIKKNFCFCTVGALMQWKYLSYWNNSYFVTQIHKYCSFISSASIVREANEAIIYEAMPKMPLPPEAEYRALLAMEKDVVVCMIRYSHLHALKPRAGYISRPFLGIQPREIIFSLQKWAFVGLQKLMTVDDQTEDYENCDFFFSFWKCMYI